MLQLKSLLMFVLAAVLLTVAHGRILNDCQVANEMLQHGVPREEIPDWVCLVKGESSGNTAALGQLNTDGSTDYGLYQINGRYWCGATSPGGGCNIPCSDLTNDDIGDDITCAQHIKGIHGFAGWVAWKNKCEGQALPDVSNC